jgi:ATP-dependent RNA helicase DOB1
MPEAGPSTPRKRGAKKRGADPLSPPTSKSARIDNGSDSDTDAPHVPKIDEGDVHMDPMAALENEGVPDGAVEEVPQAESQIPGVAPVRADEFSTEAEREVDADKGLGGGSEESKLKLVHSVRHEVRISVDLY